mgnify:CR=1 FL=1
MAGETVITVVGNLTADPELRFTPNGAAVANFTVASTPRTFDRQTNEWKDGEALFLRCSVWREAAENVAESLTKGMRVIVQGRLRARSYDDRDGNRRTSWELDVDEVGPASAWDLYCGVGGFAFHLARAGVRDVWGMESSAEAVAAARETAAELGLADRARFSAGDATSALSFEKRRAPEALSSKKRRPRPDAVVVNPPRRGIGAELADALEDSGVPTVLYSSCNPATLAQDLARMPSYRVARVQVFDMFPQTRHAEVLTLLTRR